jgi:hypothetical protein
MQTEKTLVVYIPRQNTSNDIIFDYDLKIRKELEKINCEWYYSEMSINEGEGCREVGFDIIDVSRYKITKVINEFNKNYNINVQYSIYSIK